MVTYCKLNSMLVTLGMMTLLRGVALNITNGGAQTTLPDEFRMVADLKVAGIATVSYTHLTLPTKLEV